MSESVLKYQADSVEIRSTGGAFALMMQANARVVLAAMQRGVLCLWAIADPAEPADTRREFLLRGTGHPLPLNVRHVHSFLQNEGEFVWHIFEPLQ